MKKKVSSGNTLRNSNRRQQQQSLKSNQSRGNSACSMGSANFKRLAATYDSQDDYNDHSQGRNNAENLNNHNAQQFKRLQTSSSKKIQNSSIQQNSNKIRVSSKRTTNKSDANVALLLNSDQGSIYVNDWRMSSEKALRRQTSSSKQSLKASKDKLLKQQSKSKERGASSNSKSAAALITQQQAHENGSQERKRSPIKKQSSLKKFDQRLYQHSYTKIFVMGDTKFGQLGFLNPNEHNSSLSEEQRQSPIISVPKLCSYNILIKQIACGEAHTHLLSQDGYVYSMGSNQYGVLGLGKGDDVLQAVTQPQLVPNLQCIVEISSGRAHSVALDVQREVYGWGRSDTGAIGNRLATPQHQSHPMPLGINVDSNDQVVQIDCGLEHTFFLTSDGHVFACGEGEYGQLGLGYVSLKEYRPIRVKFKDLKPGDYVTKIACGAHHTAFLTRFKSVYTTGANNLGQLGLDSLAHQINTPTLVEALEEKDINDITCGEGSFAITTRGDLYVWGLYNLEIYRKPFLPQAMSRPVSHVSQSFYGVTGAIDLDEQAWYWHSQLEVDTQNAMRLPAYPNVIKQMKRRLCKKVVAGKDLIFALGDDVNTNQSSSTVKDSQATSNLGLQEIPERDEHMHSSTLTHKQLTLSQVMPALDLQKIHKDSTGSLVLVPSQGSSSHKAVSKSRSRSRSKGAPTTHEVPKRRRSASVKKVRRAKSRSPRSSGMKQRRRRSSQKKRNRSASASRNTSETGNKRRIVSRSRSSGGARSRSSMAGGRSDSQGKVRQMTQKHVGFDESMQSQKAIRVTSKKRQTLEKKVEKRFQDLSQRLESDKEDVTVRLQKLCQKVNKIQKATSSSAKTRKKQKKTKNQSSTQECNTLPQLLQRRQQNPDPLSDLNCGSTADIKSQEDHVMVTDQQADTKQAEEKDVPSMFNSELQDELNQISKPQLIYSPKDQTVDIRSPKHHLDQQPHQLRVHVSDSPTQSRGSKVHRVHEKLRPQMEIMGQAPMRVRSLGTLKSPVQSPKQGSVKSVKSSKMRSRQNVRSPKQTSYEQQLMMQLRDQIDYLERQNARLNHEKVQEQVKVRELQAQYNDLRQTNLRTDVGLEAHLKSLESQLRTAKLERSDMAIKHADAERRVHDLEDKVINLQMAKNKEEDYLNQLGRSHENLRQEKNKNRDTLLQNEMLHKTISILETTIEQVKIDKDVIMNENMRLKEYLYAKDIDVNVNGYRDMIGQQADNLGRDSTENMERRSRSLGMRATSHKDSSAKSANGKRRNNSNGSLLDRTVERSNSRNGALRNRRTGSQNSNYSEGLNNLLMPEPDQPTQTDIMVGGGIAEQQNTFCPDPTYQDQFYTVNPPPRNFISQFGTKESKETSHFNNHEPPTVDRIKSSNLATYNEDDQNRDPRIQRLLQDAQVLQEKHRVLMSSSPLRLKDRSADRNSSQGRHGTSFQDATDRARSLNFTRMTEQTVQQNRAQTPAIYEQHHSASPLRVKSRSPSSNGIRPYPCEPPSQSDQTSNLFSSMPPTQQQTMNPNRFDEDDDVAEPELGAPVREDFEPDEIRQRAGISPNPTRRPQAVTDRPGPNNFKDLIKDAQRARRNDPATRTFDDRKDDHDDSYPQPSSSQCHPPRPKNDNSDYIQSQKERNPSRSRSPPRKPLDEKDKDKLADQYNQKLLDNIEKLAAKAKQRSEDEPRVNKFNRNNPSSQKENSLQSHNSKSPGPGSKDRKPNSGLPNSIFPDQEAYQNKLKQLRDGTSPVVEPRALSNESNRKRNNSQRRPPTKEEDDYETQQMLNKPAGAKKPTWTSGLGNSNEKEPQTANNNSFLARREALQNRLKKI